MKIFSLKKILSLIVIATMLATCFSQIALAEYVNPDDSPLLYSEDFSKWTPSQDVFDSKELSELSGGTMSADGTSNFKLSTDGGLTAYKPMGVSGYGISARMAFNKEYTFDELESEIEVNIDVKKDTIQNKNADGTFTDVTADEGGQRTLGFYYNKPDGSIGSVSIIKMNDLGAFMRATGNGPYYGGGSYSALPNNEGYYSLKIVLEKDQVSLNANGNTTGDLYDFCWVVRVYDRNNNNAAVYSHRYLKSNEGNTSYVELPSVAGVCISTYQPGSSSAKSESRVTIKNPVFKLNAFEAVTPSTNIISANAKKLEVEFTKNVDPDTTDENTITLTDPDGNNMVTAYSVKDNIVTLSLSGIVHNSSYTLNILDGLKSAKNSENVIPARFYFESTIENQTTILFNQDTEKIPLHLFRGEVQNVSKQKCFIPGKSSFVQRFVSPLVCTSFFLQRYLIFAGIRAEYIFRKHIGTFMVQPCAPDNSLIYFRVAIRLTGGNIPEQIHILNMLFRSKGSGMIGRNVRKSTDGTVYDSLKTGFRILPTRTGVQNPH